MSSRSDWEYRFYFNEWMRQQKFEQDWQDTIRQRASDNAPSFKSTPPQRNSSASRTTDTLFGLLLLTFSGWLGFKFHQQTTSNLFALGVFVRAVM